MGETVKDVAEHCRWLISKGRENEAAKLLLPRIEAKRRIANKIKRHKIQWDADEQNYSEFWAIHEAYMREVGENPTFCTLAIIEAMRQFDVRGWWEQRNAEKEP